MKKFITLTSVLFLIIAVLPSCGVTVVKRQHQPGYYVSTNPHYKQAKQNEEKERLRPETVTEKRSETASAGQNTEKQEELAVAEQPVNEAVAVPETENEVVTATTLQKDQKTVVTTDRGIKKATFGADSKLVNKVLDKIPMTKKMESKVKQEQNSMARGDGLSLFWIVILVLLILWALGYWGHWFAGGVIHLLLVIALILLIFWLLGLI